MHDPRSVAVFTTPGGADRHVHCAVFDAAGDGTTSPGEDGHVHHVRGCDVVTVDGHAHGLAARRCSKEHDEKGRHVVED